MINDRENNRQLDPDDPKRVGGVRLFVDRNVILEFN